MPTLRPQAPSPKGMRPTSPSAPQVPSPTPPVPKVGLTEEEFAKKLKTTLEEYYNAKDQAEVCLRLSGPRQWLMLCLLLGESCSRRPSLKLANPRLQCTASLNVGFIVNAWTW